MVCDEGWEVKRGIHRRFLKECTTSRIGMEPANPYFILTLLCDARYCSSCVMCRVVMLSKSGNGIHYIVCYARVSGINGSNR